MTGRTTAAAIGLVALAAMLGLGVPVPEAGTTAPRPFRLVFDGRHEPAADAPTGFLHEGRFTATGAFCPSGLASTPAPGDRRRRLLSCADGSGTATALVDPIAGEHGGVGAWRIVAGTGAHVRLRGRGTFRSVPTGGDPRDHGSITFRSTWAGVADLDDTPPTVAFARTSVTRLPRPRRVYLLRLAWSLQDAPGNGLRYRVAVTANGAFLASRVGETHVRIVTAVLRLHVAAHPRTIRVAIRAADPFGNERVISRELRLPT